jgi:hypothetical protein
LELTSNTSFWTWIPRISFGPFKFGDSIENYICTYGLCEYDTYSKLTFGENSPDLVLQNVDPENAYLIPQYDFAFTIYTLYSKIIDVRVETYFYYKYQDIIGLPIEEAMLIINRTTWNKVETEDVIDTIQNIYYFDDLGLIFWTLDNKIVTVFCNGHNNGDELPEDYYDYLEN